MNIGVIGVGRLGICFALLLDRGGYRVMASDIRTNYIANLARKSIKTTEPDVAEMLSASNIEFTTDTRAVLAHSDIMYVMVATPSRADGSYDTSAIDRVVDDVLDCDLDLTDRILVIGCTTNPGDCENIQDRLQHRGIHVLYNPEFIAQGTIIRDLQQADMVLIGGRDPAVIARYQHIYHAIQPDLAPNIHVMSLTAAEIVKIGINCFLTTKISYANMMGQVLHRLGLGSDVVPALTAIGTDSRVGSKYMRYGFGFGGPCLPRDNRAFAACAKRVGLDFPLGTIVDQFNRDHTRFIFQDLVRQNHDCVPFYLPYITYKPGTDITEESQALALCELLLENSFQVFVEPDHKIPVAVIEDLQHRFGDRFSLASRRDLIHNSVTVFEIDL